VSGVDEASAPSADKANLGAWLAVAAGTIGALMATLDTNPAAQDHRGGLIGLSSRAAHDVLVGEGKTQIAHK
jgi:hypothetical protein